MFISYLLSWDCPERAHWMPRILLMMCIGGWWLRRGRKAVELESCASHWWFYQIFNAKFKVQYCREAATWDCKCQPTSTYTRVGSVTASHAEDVQARLSDIGGNDIICPRNVIYFLPSAADDTLRAWWIIYCLLMRSARESILRRRVSQLINFINSRALKIIPTSLVRRTCSAQIRCFAVQVDSLRQLHCRLYTTGQRSRSSRE